MDKHNQGHFQDLDEDAALRAIIEGTATETGEGFFAALVENLAKAMNTHGAWVTEYIKESRRLRALAFWLGGEFVHDYEYDIAGTPCEAVIESASLVHYPDNMIELFPNNSTLKEIGVVSFMGVPLMDLDGRILGHLSVLDRRPMPEKPRALALFRIFAARAAAEHQRLLAESAVRQSEEKYRRIVETAEEGFLLMDKDLIIAEVNDAYCKMTGYTREAIIGRPVLDFVTDESRQFLTINKENLLAEDYRELERTVVAKDGRKIPVLVHGNMLMNDKESLMGYMAFVTDMTEQKKSLTLAAEVQKSLLPQKSPHIQGLDIAGKIITSDEIGGDYFDYLSGQECQNDHFGVVVGDVTGHGIDAALLMTTARGFLRMRASQCGSISQIITEMNRHLALDVLDSGRFMTLFYLTIDMENKDLRWVRAGHDPAILYDPTRDEFEELKGSGLALGVAEDISYEENLKTGLAEGHIIAIGTDGIWEAHNKNGEMFGKKRFRKILRQNANAPAQDIIDAVYSDLDAFTVGVRPEDDITLVVIKIEENHSFRQG
jgi:PAS domain S-box-containing protein